MDSQITTGSRRNEDIALDLLKFVANTTQIVKPQSSSAGFVSSGQKTADDQVAQVLDLYRRCLAAVSGK